jgi:hypothetical protein
VLAGSRILGFTALTTRPVTTIEIQLHLWPRVLSRVEHALHAIARKRGQRTKNGYFY